METSAFDVVVVGAGPTGLFLASELALYGCSVLVVERRAEPDATPKAGSVGVLAAEALQRRGLGAVLDAEEQSMVQGMAQLAQATGGVSPLAQGLRKIGGHFAGRGGDLVAAAEQTSSVERPRAPEVATSSQGWLRRRPCVRVF